MAVVLLRISAIPKSVLRHTEPLANALNANGMWHVIYSRVKYVQSTVREKSRIQELEVNEFFKRIPVYLSIRLFAIH